MFTGLIEEIGTVQVCKPIGGGKKIQVRAEKIMDDVKIGDSISLNGACQTVTSRSETVFEVEAVEETLRKTTLGKLAAGMKINLERAVKLGDRMGGHLVQGHVDCVGRIMSIRPEATGKLVEISYPNEYSKYLVAKGSVCIDGVSLTVAKAEPMKFQIAVIPHTWEETIFKHIKTGEEVNLEFDIIAKYVESLTASDADTSSSGGGSVLDKYIDQPRY